MGTLPLFSWCLVTRQKAFLLLRRSLLYLPFSCLPSTYLPPGNLYMFDTFSNTHTTRTFLYKSRLCMNTTDLLFIKCNVIITMLDYACLIL